MSEKTILNKNFVDNKMEIIDLNDPIIKRLNDKLTFEQKEIFIQSFAMYLKYDKNKDFVVDLDLVWKRIGYSTKGKATEAMKKNLVDNIDFSYNQVALPESKASHGGCSS